MTERGRQCCRLFCFTETSFQGQTDPTLATIKKQEAGTGLGPGGPLYPGADKEINILVGYQRNQHTEPLRQFQDQWLDAAAAAGGKL